jgi:hypothetical protein
MVRIATQQAFCAPPVGMNLDLAHQILGQYFNIADTAAGIGGRDGLVGRADLAALANTAGAPPELRAAAQFLLQNPALANALDTAAGVGQVDGLISKGDMDAYAATRGAPQVPGGFFPAAPGGGPGFCATPAVDPNLAAIQQAVQAAQQFCPAAAAQGCAPAGAAPGAAGAGGAMSPQQAAAVLDKHWDKIATGKCKTVDKEQLEEVVASGWAPPELKLAANTLLNTPNAVEQIAGAHDDGPFAQGMTRKDLNTVLSPGDTTLAPAPGWSVGGPGAGFGLPQDVQSAAAVLKRHWDDVGTGKCKSADADQLREIVASGSASPALKAACNLLLNSPGLVERLAGAHDDGPFAQGITEKDLNTIMSPGWQG